MHSTSILPNVQNCDIEMFLLPNEILVYIFKGLHVKDLLNLIKVHPHFYDIIERNASLWSNALFRDEWPSEANLKYFERAANHGNIEALIKLGIAYLYNEGLPGDFEGKKITENGTHAAAMFCRVETLTSHGCPFTWLFIRPPWSARGACCKEFVFNNMLKFAKAQGDPNVHICLAHTLALLEDENKNKEESVRHLHQASAAGSQEANYLLWLQTDMNTSKPDRGQELQSIRELRAIACQGNFNATLELCGKYAEGKYGKLAPEQAACTVREFIQSSKPSYVNRMYTFQELTHSMRYILMDWLVEVANMKSYSSLTLHLAIDMVDRVLKVLRVDRPLLQLLGVSAMVLCSRFLGKDIITIREAAWLTDNTYNYGDVVRMMGEISATLQGNFRSLTSFDYLGVLNLCAGSSKLCSLLAEYICELALLQSELGDHTRAHVAAACVLLARLTLQQGTPWPTKMETFTGFKAKDIKEVTLLLHNKCFNGTPMTDHREVELEAVRQRYTDLEFMSVSGIPIVSLHEVEEFLGPDILRQNIEQLLTTPKKCTHLDNSVHMNSAFIASPCRHASQEEHDKSFELTAEREQMATPILEDRLTDQFNDVLNRSFSVCNADASFNEHSMAIEEDGDTCEDENALVNSKQEMKNVIRETDEVDTERNTMAETLEDMQCSQRPSSQEQQASSNKIFINEVDDLICADRFDSSREMSPVNPQEQMAKAFNNRLSSSDIVPSLTSNDDRQKSTQVLVSTISDIDTMQQDTIKEPSSRAAKNVIGSMPSDIPAFVSNISTKEIHDSQELPVIQIEQVDSSPKIKKHEEFVHPSDTSNALETICEEEKVYKSRSKSANSTPHCGTSPLINMPLLSNASPIGGMAQFTFDAPTSRYIKSGIRIDFQNGNTENQKPGFKILQDKLSVNLNNLEAYSTNGLGFQVFAPNVQQISSTPMGKKNTFSIFQDLNTKLDPSKCHKSQENNISLRDLDFNVVVNTQVNGTIERAPKKRRPSGSLGNQSKKKIL